jgi:hypothetical protein
VSEQAIRNALAIPPDDRPAAYVVALDGPAGACAAPAGRAAGDAPVEATSGAVPYAASPAQAGWWAVPLVETAPVLILRAVGGAIVDGRGAVWLGSVLAGGGGR